jgi:hypothetical protein
MDQKIYFNFINIEDDFFFNETNSNVTITTYNLYGYETFTSEYYIEYLFEENSKKKKYFIQIHGMDINLFNTSNFNLEITNFSYTYSYFNDDNNKSIIIYNIYKNNYQIVYLGLPNLVNQVQIQINYNYYFIGENSQLQPGLKDENFSTQIIMMLNNYQGILNYIQNTILLDSLTYQIEITGIEDNLNTGNNINNYKLFKIHNDINLDIYTRIYIYNDLNTFSSILYLNTYNFSEYKLFPENYETIILMIEYINSSGGIYIKNTTNGKYFYKLDSNGNEIEIQVDTSVDPVYTIILSLNLQTFNCGQIKILEPYEYYNVLFFENYVDKNYLVNSVSIFESDYDKYFINTITQVEYNNISTLNNNLYENIIENDNNLTIPIIPNINYLNILINLDLISLVNLIKYDSKNNYFSNFLKSNEVSVETLINYLVKFVLIDYNMYEIINVKNINLEKIYSVENIKKVYKSNYLYDLNKTYIDKYHTNFGFINFNNNVVNSIRCKIVFLFNRYGYYSFDGKIYLNNYNLKIYHKKYDIDNVEKKKKLINLLLYIASLSWGIKIIFYNNLNSEPKVSSFYNYYLGTNPYYLFNEINLSRSLENFNIFFNIISLNNNFNSQYLKFNLEILKDYYILFLYSDKNNVLDTYDELVFNYSQYVFKIFKNPPVNGNILKDKNLFYICFQNLKELNIFMGYIKTGLFDTNIKKLSNYFDIPESVIFCNYKNINNYWVLNSLSEPIVPNGNPNILDKNKIFFSINNLHANQIFLQGKLSINPI